MKHSRRMSIADQLNEYMTRLPVRENILGLTDRSRTEQFAAQTRKFAMSAHTDGSHHAHKVEHSRTQLDPSWRHSTQNVKRDQLVTAAVGLMTAVLGLVVTSYDRDTIAAIWAGLIILCVTPGCAFACWHLTEDRLTRALTVLAGSVTWTIVVTTVLALLQNINLGILSALTAGVGGIGSAVFIIAQTVDCMGERHKVSGSTRAITDFRRKPHPSSRRLSSSNVASIITLVAAAIFWIVAVRKARGHAAGSYGLLPLLGIPFFAAVALTFAALLTALWFVRTAWPVAIASLGLLLIEFYATQKILASAPFYTYVYGHLGVVDYVVHGGPLNDPLDVYQQWPGFFAAGAALVRLSGRSPLGYANWAELFFEALNAITLFAIARRFSRHQLVPYIAVLLFITTNWEGQEYYAPQTLAFELSLLFQLLLLPLLKPERLRRVFRRVRWLLAPPLDVQMDIRGEGQVTATGRAARIVGLTALFAAIVVTHQLSPYIVFAGVAALWVLGILRHRLLMLILTLMIVGYPLLHVAAIKQNPVLSLFDLSNATGVEGFTQASPAQAFGSNIAKVICVVFWGATAVCGLSYRRRIGTVAIPVVLAVMPLSLVMVSSYGSEGIFRAFLFSSPWCALIMAMRLTGLARAPMFRLVIVGLCAMFAALGSAQSGDFGQYPVIQMPIEEIRASEYFLDHAPVNSALVLAASNFPSRINGRYVLHDPTQTVNDPGLDTYPQFEGNKLKRMSPKALASAVSTLAKGSGYLVVAPSMYPFLAYYRSFSPGTLQTLVRRLKVSSYWKVWYDNSGTIIFQALPQGRE